MWRIVVVAMILLAGAFELIPAALNRSDGVGDWARICLVLWAVVILGLIVDNEFFGFLAVLAILPAILMTGMMAFAPPVG